MTVTCARVLPFDFRLVALSLGVSVVENMPLHCKETVLSTSLKSPFFLKKLF